MFFDEPQVMGLADQFKRSEGVLKPFIIPKSKEFERKQLSPTRPQAELCRGGISLFAAKVTYFAGDKGVLKHPLKGKADGCLPVPIAHPWPHAQLGAIQGLKTLALFSPAL